jgi:hypothetical protein
MLTLSIILLSLLSTALAFSLVELGLMAYAVWGFSQDVAVSYLCGFDVCYNTVKGSVPDVAAFLMFCAVWSTLASATAIGVPLFFHSRNGHHHNSWLAPGLIVLYFLSWLFWLAGFADLANIIGTYGTSIMNAVLAFAILSWYVLFFFFFPLYSSLTILAGSSTRRSLFSASSPFSTSWRANGPDTSP